MGGLEPENISHLAKTIFNITADEDQIVPVTGYKHQSYFITDVASEKKYILEILSPLSSSNVELNDIVDQMVEKAYEFSSRNKYFSTPKIYKTSDGKLSGSADTEFVYEYKVRRKKMITARLFEFLPGKTIVDYINQSSDFSECNGTDNLFRNLGFVCGNITHFFSKQTDYLYKLAQLRSKYEWQTSTCDFMVTRLADLLYPNKSHARRIMIDQVLEEFASKKRRFDALPKRILHGALSPKNILFNPGMSEFGSSGDQYFQKLHLMIVDFQEIQVGPECVELATLILNCILERNRIHELPLPSLIKIPRLIIQGYKRHLFTTEFFSTGQLEFLPSVMKLRLCLLLLHGDIAIEKGSCSEEFVKKNDYGWAVLKCWIRLFHEDYEVIDTWIRPVPLLEI